MTNEIASAATHMSQLQLANQVQTSVLDKSLDVAEAQGAAVNQMLQSSEATGQNAQPAAPGVAADANLGNRVDLFA
jgi:hypothetical protein